MASTSLGPIVTRAIFLDFATADAVPSDRAITAEDLIAAVWQTGISPEAGDALVVRTGWLKAWRAGTANKSATAGLHHDCAPWIVETGFALVAADNIAVEVMPSHDPNCAMPLHISLTRDNGIYLAELFDLETLAMHGRSAFMLAIAPLLIAGGVGSPITPVAIFLIRPRWFVYSITSNAFIQQSGPRMGPEASTSGWGFCFWVPRRVVNINVDSGRGS